MEAGSFNTIQDAVTKFVNVNSSANTANVLNFRQNRNFYRQNRESNFRQNYRQPNRGNNYNRRARGSRGRFNSNNRQTQYRGNYNNHNNNTRSIRLTESTSGNETDPSQVRDGEN